MKTLYRARIIRTQTYPATGGWILIDGRHVQRVGVGEPPQADRIVDLPGATIVPGFVDTHVHLTATGIAIGETDVAAARGKDELLDAARRRAASPGPVFVSGFDETMWDAQVLPTLGELDAVSEEALAIRRADGHVTLANSAAMRAADVLDLDGVERGGDGEPTGRVTRAANERLRRWFALAMADRDVQELQLEAAALAAARGITSVHEMSMPVEMGLRDLEVLLGHSERLPVDVVPIVATTDIPQVMDLRLSTIGGDLPVDGSVGARTAALEGPYADGSGLGVLYHDDAELLRFFEGGHGAGLQVGVHAIGDRAIEQVLTAWESVYGVLDSRGRRHLRARRHRIEHVEMPTDDQIERAAVLGLALSVQPAFDALWGGRGGLYETGLGWERAEPMNPFRSFLDRGMEIGVGSDAPVTPLDPMLGVDAMEHHHAPEQRLTRAEAIRLSTIGGARLAHMEDKKGALGPGMHADLAAYDDDPFESDSVLGLRPILSVSLGREVFAS
jgi:predicted amidohydrolase YtcJ